tara:strand:+ start:309 stop:434 length:126 start_codon:yes stop_codon:yes gene_type:complete
LGFFCVKSRTRAIGERYRLEVCVLDAPQGYLDSLFAISPRL